jgi:hypothetical protein
MYRANPGFIPRNHLVEAVIAAATDSGDLGVFHAPVDVLAQPNYYRPEQAQYAMPPRPEQVVRQTLCGTCIQAQEPSDGYHCRMHRLFAPFVAQHSHKNFQRPVSTSSC